MGDDAVVEAHRLVGTVPAGGDDAERLQVVAPRAVGVDLGGREGGGEVLRRRRHRDLGLHPLAREVVRAVQPGAVQLHRDQLRPGRRQQRQRDGPEVQRAAVAGGIGEDLGVRGAPQVAVQLHRRVAELDGAVRALVAPRARVADRDREREHERQHGGHASHREAGRGAGRLELAPPRQLARRVAPRRRRREQDEQIAGHNREGVEPRQVWPEQQAGGAERHDERHDRPCGLFEGVREDLCGDRQDGREDEDEPRETRGARDGRGARADGVHAVGHEPAEPGLADAHERQTLPVEEAGQPGRLGEENEEPGNPERGEDGADDGRGAQEEKDAEGELGIVDQQPQRKQREADGEPDRQVRERPHRATPRQTSGTGLRGA